MDVTLFGGWARAWIQWGFAISHSPNCLPFKHTWDRSCSNLLFVWDETLLVDVWRHFCWLLKTFAFLRQYSFCCWRHLLPDSPLRPSPPRPPLFPSCLFLPSSLTGYYGATIAWCRHNHPKNPNFQPSHLIQAAACRGQAGYLEIWNEMFTLAEAGFSHLR